MSKQWPAGTVGHLIWPLETELVLGPVPLIHECECGCRHMGEPADCPDCKAVA